MKTYDVLFAVLLVVGGLNWDLVAGIFGDMSALSRIVYLLVGIAAVYQGLSWKSIQRRWGLRPQMA